MKSIVKFLKAIYFAAISIALILIGGVISGNKYNGISALLFVLGVIFLLVSILLGVSAFSHDKDDTK